jgi:uncharacterized protein YbjT (DUF2867 family)
MNATPNILVLGASGLIGHFLTQDLRKQGFVVVAVARKFTAAQASHAVDLEMPVLMMDSSALARLIGDQAIDVVVNCLGVLQDGPGSDTRAVHRDFVERLLQAINASRRAIRFIHMSIPGAATEDHTAFSMTKREAERMIAASDIPYAILRPGFVIAPAAYGGSAMVRALAALPLQLPSSLSKNPFQPVMVEDLVTTVAWLASRDIADKSVSAVIWDVMLKQPITLGGVIELFRRSLGAAGFPRMPFPGFLLSLGVTLGDLATFLGWKSPMRSTAIAELRRGVTGNPSAWMAATGIVPADPSQPAIMGAATIQDKWFARLYLIKALIVASLVMFWTVSGLIALFVSYEAAARILSSHAFPSVLVAPITVLTSLMDMTIGVLIAFRRTCAFGLIWGFLASLGYMVGAAILTPDLWVEPLGALVKTGPAIVLMLVALLILDNR